MARIKNISGDDRSVPALGGRRVWAGQIVDVPDEDLDGYVCQVEIWAPVDDAGNPIADPEEIAEAFTEAQQEAIAEAAAELYEPTPVPTNPDEVDLSGLTKAELLEHAAQAGVDVPGSGTKAEIIAAISGATHDDPAVGGQEV